MTTAPTSLSRRWSSPEVAPLAARAAQELMRRGRGVLYIPSGNADYMSADDFAKLLQGLLDQNKQ